MRWHKSHGQGLLGIVRTGRLEVCSDCGTPKGHPDQEKPCAKEDEVKRDG